MNPVLDASVLVAVVSPQEHHHAAARQLFDSVPPDEPFLVPALFRAEVIAALARRGEGQSVLDAVDALVQGPRFHSVPIDSALLEVAVRVARNARLRAYDAVYCAVALTSGEPLYTLDQELRANLAQAHEQITVRCR